MTTPEFAQNEYSHIQLGMVNPPRRVKRLREIALKELSTPHSVLNPVPSASGSAFSSSSPERPPTPPAGSGASNPRRRGRKPAGPLSRSAREQLRKTNHSVIEKRRREKINEALAALRELVPNEKQIYPNGSGNAGGVKEEREKEFKLEVLVRTVEYLKGMVERVRNLETKAVCRKCGGEVAPLVTKAMDEKGQEEMEEARPVKRMRIQEPDSESEDIDNENDDAMNLHALPSPPLNRHQPHQAPAPPRAYTSRPASPHLRLPSISSWMSDKSLINTTTSISPPGSLTHSYAYQLPSPPQTVPFAPTTIASTGFPPRLVLPSPIGPTPRGLASFKPTASPAPFTSHPHAPGAPSLFISLPSPNTLNSCPSPASLKLPHSPSSTSYKSPTPPSLAFPGPFPNLNLSSPALTGPRSQERERERERDVPELPLELESTPPQKVLNSPPHSSGHRGRNRDRGGRSSNGIQHSNYRRTTETRGSASRVGGFETDNGGSNESSGAGRVSSGTPGSPWSRDDQTAASLLLNISTRCSGSKTNTKVKLDSGKTTPGLAAGTLSHLTPATTHDTATTPAPTTHTRTRHTYANTGAGPSVGVEVGLEAQTPSSLLGMGEDSGCWTMAGGES